VILEPATDPDAAPGVPIALALGANLGNPLAQLRSALVALRAEVADLRVSHPYRSAPMYTANQPEFLNAVAMGRTQLGPAALLAFLKRIEFELGRMPGPRNGPRQIDLDVLTYGVLIYRRTVPNAEALIIPHPRLAERRFVLDPWAELAPETVIPGQGSLNDLRQNPVLALQDLRRLDDALLVPGH